MEIINEWPIEKIVTFFEEPIKDDDTLLNTLNRYEKNRNTCGGEYLILIKHKYWFEKEYEFSLEVLSRYYGSRGDVSEWLDDWREGQQDVIFIGFVDILFLESEYEKFINKIYEGKEI